jgi:FhaA, N-terminal domain/FHA domain
LLRPASGWAGSRPAALSDRDRYPRLSVLRSIERTIGGLFEGVFSRTFRSTVQPVELARKLAKEMDDHKTISIHRVYVPDEYTIFLNPADREQFAAYETQMRSELAEYLVEHARREGYSLAARPLVLLETEPDLTVGTFGIAVSSQSPGSQEQDATPADLPAAEVMPPPAAAVAPPAATMIYAPAEEELPPAPEPEQREETATLEWSGGTVTIEGRVAVIGRSSDCDVRVDDANVSRRHAEVRRIGDGYSLVDLGSTNGTEVNGQRIQETALMNGDVISVGTTRITFERRLG